MSTFQIIFMAIFAGSGALLFMAGLVLLFGTLRFVKNAASAQGTVVGHETRVRTDQDGRTAFVHPQVEFTDPEGQTHRVTLATGTAGMATWATGTQVDLLFSSADTQTARIRCFTHLWFLPLVLTGGGFLGVVCGVLLGHFFS